MLPLAFLIVRGRFGRSLRAVRDSEIAATANGVSTARDQDAPRSGSRRSSAASPARSIAIGITYVNPDTFPIDLSILLLVGIVIGGAGSLYGHALRRALRRVHPDQLGPGAARPGLTACTTSTRRPPDPGSSSTALVLLLVLYVAPAGRSRRLAATASQRGFRSRRNRASLSDRRTRIVRPADHPPRSLRTRRETHEKDVPADRRGTRRRRPSSS